MRTLIHKSLALKQGDIIMKEYLHDNKIKKVVFEVIKVVPVAKKCLTGKFKLVGFGKRRRRVEIFRLHAKNGYIFSVLAYYSDDKRIGIFDDTDNYYPPQIRLMFNRMKFSDTKFYLLDDSEALLYKGL